MHHHLDPTTLLRQRAAETDRIVAARHHRSYLSDRAGAPRSAIRRAFDHLGLV